MEILHSLQAINHNCYIVAKHSSNLQHITDSAGTWNLGYNTCQCESPAPPGFWQPPDIPWGVGVWQWCSDPGAVLTFKIKRFPPPRVGNRGILTQKVQIRVGTLTEQKSNVIIHKVWTLVIHIDSWYKTLTDCIVELGFQNSIQQNLTSATVIQTKHPRYVKLSFWLPSFQVCAHFLFLHNQLTTFLMTFSTQLSRSLQTQILLNSPTSNQAWSLYIPDDL